MSQSGQYLLIGGRDEKPSHIKRMCSSGAHVSWTQVYKAHVGGVSPQCGIGQIREA